MINAIQISTYVVALLAIVMLVALTIRTVIRVWVYLHSTSRAERGS